ncbi:MAG: hypothetical protein A2054_09715 [Deltaproteobacteria bacterium GWA2_55_10]|nr:MAG: hypothetical protein A2054_09715 [Deltaproteobacteria bacterium GWA2_55_10]
MNIALIVSTFPKLSETFILNQITGLIDMGHSVTIFAEYRGKEEKVHTDVERYGLREKTFHFVTPEQRLKRTLSGMKLLASNIGKAPIDVMKSINFLSYGKKAISLKILHLLAPFLGKRFDIIHSHFGINGALAIYLKLLGVKGRYITSFHGYDVNSLPFKAAPGYYDTLFRHGDLFIANTTFTRKRAVELGCDERKLITLPVGVDLRKFGFRQRSIMPGEPLRLLTIGRLVEKKGHEYALKAVKILASRGLKVRYTIAGDGPERERLLSLARSLGITEHVEFLYDVNDKEAVVLYDSCHIFLLHGVTARDHDREGQALVLQEAQAAGLPVVSTWHNGIPEGVLDGVTGFLCPERDEAAIAEKIGFLAQNTDIWIKMGEAGRKFVEGKYDSVKINRELANIYSGLLTAGEREMKDGTGAERPAVP